MAGFIALLVFLVIVLVIGLFGLAYLAACGGAERWLSLADWWGRRAPSPAQGGITTPAGDSAASQSPDEGMKS